MFIFVSFRKFYNGFAGYRAYNVAKQLVGLSLVWLRCEKYREVITKYFRSPLVQAIIIIDIMKVCHAP